MFSESFTLLRKRAKAVDEALKLKYEKHRATASLDHQTVMDSSRKVWEDVVKRVDATAKFLQEAEVMGLSLEAAISCKEEVVNLWEMLENADSQKEELLKRLTAVEKQLDDIFQDREILISRLIAHNITNKLARRTIPNLNEPKKAIGYNFDNIKANKKTNMVLFNDYTTRYPDLEIGLKFLFNAGLQVAHPKQLVNKDGTELVLTENVLANCLKGAFGENHPDYLGMESALKLLKDLALDLKEDLVVNTW